MRCAASAAIVTSMAFAAARPGVEGRPSAALPCRDRRAQRLAATLTLGVGASAVNTHLGSHLGESTYATGAFLQRPKPMGCSELRRYDILATATGRETRPRTRRQLSRCPRRHLQLGPEQRHDP